MYRDFKKLCKEKITLTFNHFEDALAVPVQAMLSSFAIEQL